MLNIHVYIDILNMGFITYIGKALIVASILLQAFLLFQDQKEGAQFNKNLKAATTCHCFDAVRIHLQQYLRLVVAGLLATSAVMLLVKCCIFKLATLIGLIILLVVENHAIFCKIPTIAILDNVAFFHSLGVIGAVLYIAASECAGCGKKCSKGDKAEKASEKAAEKVSKTNDKPKKGKRD